MQLKYFNLTDTAEVLKSKRHLLVKKHHPDKAPESQKVFKTEIMKRINTEYDFVLKTSKGSKSLVELKYSKQKPINKEAQQQAQNIFHALTNLSSVDYLLLLNTIMVINNWKEVTRLYYQMYGISIDLHLKKILPLKDWKKILRIILS